MLLLVFLFGVVLPTLVTVACFIGFLVCWFYFRSRRRILVKKCGSRSRVHVAVTPTRSVVRSLPTSRSLGLQTRGLQLLPTASLYQLSPGNARPVSSDNDTAAVIVEEIPSALQRRTTLTRPIFRRTQYVIPPHRQHEFISGTTMAEVHNDLGTNDDDNGYVLTEFIRETTTSGGTSLPVDSDRSPSVESNAAAPTGSSDYYVRSSVEDVGEVSDYSGKHVGSSASGVRCVLFVRGGTDSEAASSGSVKLVDATRPTGCKNVCDVSTSLSSLQSWRQLTRQCRTSSNMDEFGYVDVEQIERHVESIRSQYNPRRPTSLCAHSPLSPTDPRCETIKMTSLYSLPRQ